MEKRFASVSRSHILCLRNEQMSLKKGSESMNTFFQRNKEIRDKLGVVTVYVDVEELIYLALEAFPPKYDAFCSTIQTRSDVVTIEELNPLLNAKERSIKKGLIFEIHLHWLWQLISSINLSIKDGERMPTIVVMVMEEVIAMVNSLVVNLINLLLASLNSLANPTMVKVSFPLPSHIPSLILHKVRGHYSPIHSDLW